MSCNIQELTIVFIFVIIGIQIRLNGYLVVVQQSFELSVIGILATNNLNLDESFLSKSTISLSLRSNIENTQVSDDGQRTFFQLDVIVSCLVSSTILNGRIELIALSIFSKADAPDTIGLGSDNFRTGVNFICSNKVRI